MTTQIKRRRGTTTEHSTFTGAEGEITIDTTKDTVVVHDGSTAGGHPLAKESSIAGKVDSSGDSMTGNLSFGDNDKAIFGAGSDLQIYHNGSDSFIDDAGTGNLNIRGSSTVQIGKYTGEVAAQFVADGEVSLRYNNSEKLATTSTGIDVTGTVTADGLTVDGNVALSGTAAGIFIDETDTANLNSFINTNNGRLGIFSVNDAHSAYTNRLRIDHSTGDISFYEDTGTTPKFFWDASAESLGIGTSSPARQIHSHQSSGGSTNYAIFTNTQTGSTSSDGVIVGLNATLDGYFWNYEGGNLIFGTSSTERMRIDSSGNVGIGSTTPNAKITLKRSGAGLLANGDDGTVVALIADTTGSVLTYGTYTSHPVTFKTANGERMRIDSSGNVGIGTSSPRVPIDVAGAGATTGGVTSHAVLSDTASFAINKGGLLSFEGKYNTAGNPASWASIGGLKENATDGNYAGYLQFNTRANGANQTEAMRIDSSGNLLVGKTNSNGASVGVEARANGTIFATKASSNPAGFNRTTSDGAIVNFYKDNSTVGSIGTRSDKLYIHTTDGANGSGLRLSDGYIIPCESDGSSSDANTDLGLSGTRFKDLYLSGGVYLGGTGPANKLDDYEEGTWTPSFRSGFSGAPTFNTRGARYTKIGRMVYCDFYIQVTGTGSSGQIQVDGLPFTSTSNSLSRGGGLSTYVDMITGSTFQFYGGPNINYFSCYIDGNTSPSFSGSISSKYLIGIYTYETDA